MKSFCRFFLTILLPLGAGAGLCFFLPQFSQLTRFEEEVFWFPERFSKEPHWIEREQGLVRASNIGSESERFHFQQFIIDEETRKVFRNETLSAANWVFLLNRLRETGSDSLVLTDPLSWPNSDEISLRALQTQLDRFRHLAMAIGLTQSPIPQNFPAYLDAATIPYKGDISQIPEVNSVISPPSVTAPYYGFTHLNPSEGRMPLIVRWGDKILPSLELAFLIALNDGEVEVTLGESIECGVILPIDSRGSYELPSPATLTESNIPRSLAKMVTDSPSLSGPTFLMSDRDPPRLREIGKTVASQATRLPRDTVSYAQIGWISAIVGLLVFIWLISWQKWLILPFLAVPAFLTIQFQLWLPLSPFLLAFLLLLIFAKKRPNKVREKKAGKKPSPADVSS